MCLYINLYLNMKSASSAQAPISEDRYIIPNLDRALRTIELLSNHSDGLSASDIGKELGIPQNSAFRIARTLEGRGYISRDNETKTFQLTPKLFTVGATAAGRAHNLIEIALDPMRQLRDLTRETVLLGTILGAEGVVLEQVVGTHNFKFMVNPGLRFSLHTAAPGKAMLAELPEDERERILAKMPFEKFTNTTITSRSDFRLALEDSRKQGYGIDHGEEVEGQHCLGSAILDRHGYPVGSVWITAPSSRVPESQFEQVGAHIASTALTISQKLGYQA